MRFPIRPALAALCLLAPGAAHAQTAADDGDIKCMVIMFALASAADAPPAMKQFAPVGAGYFYGKLKGRSQNLDLQTHVVDVVKGLKPTEMQPETVRCGGELQGVGADLQGIGKKLQDLSTAAPKP